MILLQGIISSMLTSSTKDGALDNVVASSVPPSVGALGAFL
ncbi:hypothetical protein GCM10010978_30800 [Compostibacillus humi]|uniref:Uncharacterized protein n=1 Tax=Compostibacillus humi TaxID=1245525 RepID=A0A8J2TTK4_9BACI|nr:hypothetical protein GCM10010978_30800 [Compostibacillus humi]